MIKIRKPPQGQNVGKTVAPGKAVPGTDRGTKLRSSSELRLNPSRLDTINSALKSLADPKLVIPGQALPALRGLLSLMKQYQPASGCSDLILAGRFLGSWIETYGPGLPDQVKKDLVLLKQYLQTENHEGIRKNGILHYLDGFSTTGGDLPFRSLIIYRESGGDGERKDPLFREEEDSLSCVLNLNFPRLKQLSVILKKDDKNGICCFYSRENSTRRLIRHSLSDLIRKLRKAELSVPELKVKARLPSLHQKFRDREDVALWG